MIKRRLLYLIVTILFVFISAMIIFYADLNNSVSLSITIQIILIFYMIRVGIGCVLYIKKQFQKQKYSYTIILNLGLLIFIIINVLRMINLLIVNWKTLEINGIYTNTLKSFSYFTMLTLPCIIILAIYSIITNIILIKKEGFAYRNFLGIFLGFICLLGLFGSQTIYVITSKMILKKSSLLIKKFVDINLNASLSYLYSLIIATIYCNIKAAKHNPNYDKDYVIILGAKIKNDGTLTPLLKARVDRAIEFAKNQKKVNNKNIIFVPSGGKGKDEIISEAEAIKRYLVEKGISPKTIIIENKSTSTNENMRFSKNKIENNNTNAKIAFSTTNYHVFRSGVIASNEGMDCEGMGSETKWYYYANALIREFIATLYAERKKHIILLIIINIFMFLITYIGYYYKFFGV